ncbi:MAG: GNAT family N-acetyltransferase [Bdellovibrionaceae bacterium]|nr:GNAT family N-acetyltransferase [Pseudobdellovibrionaceae bacterium]
MVFWQNDIPPRSFKVLDPSMLEDILGLRQAVLHPHGPPQRVTYAQDLHPRTLHIGAFEGAKLVGVGTLIPEDEDEVLSERIFRIRGMAVLPEFQGSGIGHTLLEMMFNHLIDNEPKAEMIWCNARISALNLYTSFGFKIHGAEFDIPGSGPHKRLRRIWT